MRNLFKSFMILITYLITLSKSQSIVLKCGSIDPKQYPNACIIKDPSSSKTQTSFIFDTSICEEQGLVCNQFFDKSTTQVNCTTPQTENLVDGQQCTDSIECASNNCVNKICVGLPDGSPCDFTIECTKGSYCQNVNPNETFVSPTSKFKCAKQAKQNEKCLTNDNELGEFACVNNNYCVNNQCVPLLSLKENSYLSEAFNYKYGSFLCESGFSYYDSQYNQYICASEDSVVLDKKTCSYSLKGQRIEKKDFEGFNYDGETGLCSLINPKSKILKKAVSYIRYFMNSSHVLDAHPILKFTEPKSLYVEIEKAIYFPKISSKSCVNEYLYLGESLPPLTNQKCLSLSCEHLQNNTNQCFTVSGTNVDLAVCKAGFYCPNKEKILTNLLSSKAETCTEQKKIESNFISGLKCKEDDECASFKCIDEKCEGIAEGGACSNHEECEIGSYCEETCKPLKKLNESCSKFENSDNCEGSICFKGKCVLPFSLKDDELAYETLEKKMSGSNYLCNSGYSGVSGKCISPVIVVIPDKNSFVIARSKGFSKENQLSCTFSNEKTVKPSIITKDDKEYKVFKNAILSYLNVESKSKSFLLKYEYPKELEFLAYKFKYFPILSDENDEKCFQEYFSQKDQTNDIPNNGTMLKYSILAVLTSLFIVLSI